MFTRRITSLGARTFLLLAPLLTTLGPATVHAAESRDFSDLVNIGGGRKMYLDCRGSGSPTVVLVSGLRASADDWSIAQKGAAVFRGRQVYSSLCL